MTRSPRVRTAVPPPIESTSRGVAKAFSLRRTATNSCLVDAWLGSDALSSVNHLAQAKIALGLFIADCSRVSYAIFVIVATGTGYHIPVLLGFDPLSSRIFSIKWGVFA